MLTDDLEIYNRIGLGISSEGAEWLQIGRGYQSDLPDERGGHRGQNSTSEIYIRNMFERLGRLHGRRPRPEHSGSWKACQQLNGPQGTHTAEAHAGMGAGKRLEVQACEQFLLHEARLLDDARFDEWLALFTPEATYWVPSEPGQANPLETVSLIYDDRQLLETRVRRLASPAKCYSQEPRSRTSRIVTNVTIEDDADPATTLIRSKFVLIEFRRNEQRLFGGTSFHRLTIVGGNIRIASKRVDLVNCDAPLDGIVVPFELLPSVAIDRYGVTAAPGLVAVHHIPEVLNSYSPSGHAACRLMGPKPKCRNVRDLVAYGQQQTLIRTTA